MHLVIADMLLDRLKIQRPALFYCGNLAPDAIMARENYVREMKNHTHFKEGQKPYTFRNKESQQEYFPRLMAFYEEKLKNNFGPDRELYLGYIVHILVDELYLLHYYEDFVSELYKNGKSPADADFSKAFVEDVDLVDWELVRSYRFKFPMPEVLFEEDDYEIAGWITAGELRESKKFIVHKNFELKHEAQPLHVTTHEKNRAFINYCVERIPEILKDRFGLLF